MANSSLAGSGQALPASGLVGRLAELAEIDQFLDETQSGLHALLLSGRAGIGKTSLWKAAADRARNRGVRVLACRPTEVETQLSFSALVDLFDDLADELLPRLPDPQRQALGAALLRTSPEAAPAPLGVALGVLAAIRDAAERGPVVIAIDDVPWLDPSSAGALEFALRRLEDAPLGLLATQRTDGARVALPSLVASIPAERRSTVEVGSVSVNDVGAIVERVLGMKPLRPTLVRIHELSGGNTFYALEIARALQRRGSVDGHEDLPVPESLEGLLHDRIDALPAPCAEVALYAAALSAPTRSVLDAALGRNRVDSAVAAGIASAIFEVDGDTIRFSHPLLAASIYRRATPEHRRAVHRGLADVVGDPEERARHLALSVEEPDAAVADALEDAAAIARGRGAAAAAADLAEASIRITPADDDESRRRRAMAAAEYHVTAGAVPVARLILQRVAAETPPTDRGPILAALGQDLLFLADMDGARDAFHEALPLAGDDLALRARINMGLAGAAWLTRQDMPSGARAIAAALADAEASGDPVLLLQAIGHFATWQFIQGRGLSAELVERAARLEDWRAEVIVLEHPDLQFARIRLQLGETSTARGLCERLLADARRRGDWSSQPFLLDLLAVVEQAAGNWDISQRYCDESRAAAVQSGQETSIIDGGNAQVRLLALRGDVARCRAAADAYLEMSKGLPIPNIHQGLLTSLGLLELSLGDAAAALAPLAEATEAGATVLDEPAINRLRTTLTVEALIGVGRLDEAEAILEPYERLARRRRRIPCVADAAMCRALLLAARLDLDGALEAVDEAGRTFASLGLPFETARVSLIRGEILRRARKKAAAREAVAGSLAIFERLGADRWADRARAELDRTEGRRTSSGVLTETQQRVAELAAAGETNREIADALFMSVHTVEAHLTRIYRLLDVHSRTELARYPFDRATPGSTRER